VVEDKSGVPDIWAFIDRTIRLICRPSTFPQRPFYTGYKKCHRFKFQGLSFPDSIISIAGPFEASASDWRIWHDSNIEHELRTIFRDSRDTPFYIYRDPAYSGAYRVLGAYTRVGRRALSGDEKVFNIIMAQVRITIKQLFGNTLVI
jgi:hypothetical protein